MKKSFITFCAFALLATQAPAANAASTTGGEVTPQYKSTQNYEYKKIASNKYFINGNSVSNFIEIKNDNFKDGKISIKIKKVKKSVSNKNEKGTVEEVPAEQLKAPVKEATTEQPKAPAKEATSEQPKAPAKEVTSEQPKAPVKEVAPEQPKATETTQTSTQSPAKQPTNTVASNSSDIDAIEAAVVELTNAERVKAGLQPFKTHAPLMAAAREKSQDMKDKNYFSHTSPTYGSPFDRLKALGISYKAAGENIAKGQRTAQEVVTAWMNSEGHRANILNANFTHIGVGYVKDGNIWTQQFIKQ
ncbi:CAP domain-containing protein [Solibacillus sp. FSL W8-0372]|uniref:CAP domain-containing protein n=1 Tax=Solibacillus sp. FSL W8-0372 TaxID=2921713 RepID=UPI0030D294B1